MSRLRDFDLTPCFEEGIVLSGLLAIFIVLAAFRCYVFRTRFEDLGRSRKSVWILRTKLVKCTVVPSSELCAAENHHVSCFCAFILRCPLHGMHMMAD